ncbi:spore germination protein [Bacillus cereus]|uniref:spore germination protein n=1 Tax=Bacillus cereus TaxID=1396 RepID=UPI000BEE61DB|nr:spore germination protein [Bacillus cereus]PEF60752.1 spore germination protein [Bacillus cereus]
MSFFHNRYQKKYQLKMKNTYSMDKEVEYINDKLSKNVEILRKIFYQAPDFVIRQFQDKQTKSECALVYLDGLTDRNLINNHILQPLIYEVSNMPESMSKVTIGGIDFIDEWEQIEKSILQGRSVLFIDGHIQVQVFNTQGWPQRTVEAPQLEPSLNGAHQGFIETSSQNIAMLRRFIANRELKIKECKVGRRSESKISILYLADSSNQEILHELEKRIQNLDVDCILNTGELGALIEDNPYSPFPQFFMTERVDSAASQILQGNYCVIMDRSPSVLIAPATIISVLQSVDDYSSRWMVTFFLRLLRFLAFFVSIFLPALYIAVISFNFQIIPLDLLLTIGESRQKVPFSPLIEAMLMEVTLELLQEAGLRLPSPIGQTVGVVGGIVIGQAAVAAGIVSNIMVIVVSFTAIASFILPNYNIASSIKLIRFPMMFLAWMYGIVGIVIGWMFLIGHILSLKSLGTSYGAPLAPLSKMITQYTVTRRKKDDTK